MIEALILTGSKGLLFPNSGPGHKTLEYGTPNLGFFGEVPTSELFTAGELSDLVRFRAGSVQTQSLTWLKFMYNRRVFFVPRVPIRLNVSWVDLYFSGLVYGTDDNGPYERSTGSANQFTLVQKESSKLLVRLMTGDDQDPTLITDNIVDDTQVKTNEWNTFIYSITSAPITTRPTNAFPKLAEGSFGFTANGDWVREQNNEATSSLVRANSSSSVRAMLKTYSSLASWRPVLELVQGQLPVLQPIQEGGQAHGLRPVIALASDFENVPNAIIKPAIDICYDTSVVKAVSDLAVTLVDEVLKPIDVHHSASMLKPVTNVRRTVD